jgi:hypothetical protein
MLLLKANNPSPSTRWLKRIRKDKRKKTIKKKNKTKE